MFVFAIVVVVVVVLVLFVVVVVVFVVVLLVLFVVVVVLVVVFVVLVVEMVVVVVFLLVVVVVFLVVVLVLAVVLVVEILVVVVVLVLIDYIYNHILTSQVTLIQRLDYFLYLLEFEGHLLFSLVFWSDLLLEGLFQPLLRGFCRTFLKSAEEPIHIQNLRFVLLLLK